jgi:hypothetical protein
MRYVLLLVVLLARDAAAHGRDPLVLSVHFRPGQPQDVIAGTTIGMLSSHDGGATWRWTCEEAIHYQDPFDPDYAIAPSGAVFAQIVGELGVDRGTCGFVAAPIAAPTISAVEATATGVVYAAAADLSDSSIYRSLDEGVTFSAVSSPGQPGDWWLSLEAAPSDPQRVYVSGYRIVMVGMDSVTQRFGFVSTNGGTGWTAMDVTALPTTPHSRLEIVGVGTDPDVVYMRVQFSRGRILAPDGGDTIFRSADRGATWRKIFTSHDIYGVAFLARSTGELIVATRLSGAWHSLDNGLSWQALVSPPHIASLSETPSGEIWAGTQNYLGVAPVTMLPDVPSDGYAIMKSTDLVTWTPVLRIQDLAGPACAPGSDVYEQCAVIDRGIGTPWCCLAVALKITGGDVDCAGPRSCRGFLDGSAGDVTMHPPDGCCQRSPKQGVTSALLVLITFAYAYRPRRAARSRARGHR